MEQAVNQFNKGLLSDTHPMVLGNDTLSDALNATFVTMNGNEVVLQNDMGNRRVDNAFLPSGYEPVGIKEYGGIIYVAAYNPITNKSLIGSFPSPERKLSKDDFPDDLKGTLDLDYFIDNKSSGENLILYLNQDTFLIPLTSDLSLHAGDKFVVYCKNLSDYGLDITNYFNILDNKVNSPKNRKYTLSLGILNSRNEFVDITKTLCRWKETSIINYENNESDLYKFNDGYFIASDRPENLLDKETIDDANLIKNRQIMEANTYSYKLIGPLYLKCTLNHILNFNYNIYGIVSDNNKVDLTVEAFITYNCPDWIVSSNNMGDDNYKSYETGKIKDGWFDLYCGIDDKNKRKINLLNNIYNINEETVYDINTNLYTVKVVKTFRNIDYDSDTNYLYYTIGVLPNSKLSNIYLSNLSEEGIIDISKLGNGTIDLTGWRFYNKDNNTILTYSFDAYPKYGYSFKDLKIVFKDITSSNSDENITLEYDEVYSGKTNVSLDWGTYGIKQGKLYSVKITVKQFENDKNYSNDEFEFIRWFISTDLMNDCYHSSSNNFIKDYGNPRDELINGKTEEDTLNNKLLVKLFFDTKILDNSEVIYNNTPYNDSNEITTGWTTRDYNFINVIYKHNYKINYQINPILKILNENLYPSSLIRISNPNGLYKIKIEENDKTPIFESNIDYIKRNNREFTNSEKNSFITWSKNLRVTNNSNIEGNIEFLDRFLSEGITEDIKINNPFGKVKDYLGKSIFKSDSKTLPLYMGLGLDYDNASDYGHFWNLHFNENSNDAYMNHQDGDVSGDKNTEQIAYSWGNNGFDLRFTDKSVVIDAFNSKAKNNTVFFYIFLQKESNESTLRIISKEGRTNINNGYSMNNYTRVWWKSTNDHWATFKDLLYRDSDNNEDLISFIIENVFKGDENIVYCFADSVSGESQITIPNTENNCVYNKFYQFKTNINFTITNNDNINVLGCNQILVECRSKHNKDIINQFKIKFTYNNSIIKENKSIDVIVNSSDLFYKDINNKVSIDGLSNIYLDTGLTTDINGEDLDKNSFYKITKEGGLLKVQVSNVKVSSEFGNEGYNTIIYTGNERWEYLKEKEDYNKNIFDAILSDDDKGETYAEYKQFTLVENPEITEIK